MKIGIDLDGVVFDTETLWATLAEIYDCKELGRNSIVRKGEPRVQEKYNWTENELNNYFDRYIDIKDFNIIPGAKEVIKLLRDEGNELIVITARGSFGNLSKNQIIAQNKLKSENLKFDKFYWNQKEKLRVCKDEKIDIMIDDNYHICETLCKNNIKTLYFRAIGRKEALQNNNIIEVYTWGEIYRYINENYNYSNQIFSKKYNMEYEL